MLRSSPNFMLIDNTRSRLIVVFQFWQARRDWSKRTSLGEVGKEKKEYEREGRSQGRGTLLAPNNDREACRKVWKTSLKR